MRPLPYSDPAHMAAHQFLVEEAALLDAADYTGWLDLLCEDIRYVMPVRVTTARGAGFDTLADMGHFDEDLYALRKRVQRLATDHAWTEDPPSRTRHFITNIRTFPNGGAEFIVESALLLFRSRGDTREADLMSAGRTDVLRQTPAGLRPGARHHRHHRAFRRRHRGQVGELPYERGLPPPLIWVIIPMARHGGRP